VSAAEIAAEARRLVRRVRTAALATLDAGDGGPFASLVTTASAIDGAPLMLLSDLSDHTRNLERDSRASLLFEAASRRANPQTGPRVTVAGRCRRDDDPATRRRFLARHPGAALYADFKDFAFYRLDPERVHYVGGFAQARRFTAADVFADACAAADLAAGETALVDELNGGSRWLVAVLVSRVLGRRPEGWQVVAVDGDGLDLQRRGVVARLPLVPLVTTANGFLERLHDVAGTAGDRLSAAGSGSGGGDPDEPPRDP
jgi:hypothetical protein